MEGPMLEVPTDVPWASRVGDICLAPRASGGGVGSNCHNQEVAWAIPTPVPSSVFTTKAKLVSASEPSVCYMNSKVMPSH